MIAAHVGRTRRSPRYPLHQRRAYSVARAIVLSHEDAEDAVQEGFSTHTARSTGFVPTSRSGRGSTGSWRTPRSIRAPAEGPRCRRAARQHRDPLPRSGGVGELRERLKEALLHLTDRQRAVIVLHDVEGFTHGEIGRTLGIPEGTARSDLHHARATLRRLLQNIRSTS